MPLSEFTAIQQYFNRPGLSSPMASPDVGIGDDGALLSVPDGHQLVVVADTLVEGVHFPLDSPASHIGYRALAVNLSDLAAMGATPLWFTLCLTVPDLRESWLEDFSQGLLDAARSCDIVLVGGDTSRGSLSITVQGMGVVPVGQGLSRGGAEVGDAVYVTGTPGDASAGLSLVLAGESTYAGNTVPSIDQLIERFWRPQPRLCEGLLLRGLAASCIDVSDGLLADLGHICTASGVGATINLDKLPISSSLAAVKAKQAFTYVLSGGDDYELCITVPQATCAELEERFEEAGLAVTRIGQVIEGDGVKCLDGEGRLVTMQETGYEHFRG